MINSQAMEMRKRSGSGDILKKVYKHFHRRGIDIVLGEMREESPRDYYGLFRQCYGHDANIIIKQIEKQDKAEQSQLDTLLQAALHNHMQSGEELALRITGENSSPVVITEEKVVITEENCMLWAGMDAVVSDNGKHY